MVNSDDQASSKWRGFSARISRDAVKDIAISNCTFVVLFRAALNERISSEMRLPRRARQTVLAGRRGEADGGCKVGNPAGDIQRRVVRPAAFCMC